MKYLSLFVPFILAYLLQDTPVASYGVAWAGSFFILWLTLSGRLKPLPGGLPVSRQLFRPIVFTQLIFASYTALTSIFFFGSVLDGTYSAATLGGREHLIALSAEAQSYYVLAHASVATGILLLMDYRTNVRYVIAARQNAPRLLLAISGICLMASMVTQLTDTMQEVGTRLQQLAVVSSVFSLALSLINREGTHLGINLIVFAVNLVVAVASGWKERVLILLLLLFSALFPFYRRATLITAAVVLTAFATVMPAYMKAYRVLNWTWFRDGGNAKVGKADALALALTMVRSGKIDQGAATREFLVERISEISLFVRYLDNVPERHPFYGTQILRQSLISFVPRMAWREKPNVERLVMTRVFENGVYDWRSQISAKPQFVVDAYLTGGIPGIVIACVIFGMLASLASRLAERWFGGYTIGSGVIYAALFQVLWRGNCFEFFVGTFFWSFVMMCALFVAGQYFGILVPAYAGSASADMVARSARSSGLRRPTPQSIVVRT